MDEFFMDNFGMYSRMQDHLLFLGRSDNLIGIRAILNMYTGKNIDYYYRETQYISEKMSCEVRKIHRDYDAYLVMENIRPMGDYREYIQLRGGDLEYLRLMLVPKLEEIIKKADQIFIAQGNKLQVTSKVKPYMVTISNDKKLRIAPEINAIDEETSEGIVALYMNNKESNRVIMSLNQVYSFMYLIRTFDIYGYAASMLAYMQRPPSKTNLRDITGLQDRSIIEQSVLPTDPSKRRVIGNTHHRRIKSYFEQ